MWRSGARKKAQIARKARPPRALSQMEATTSELRGRHEEMLLGGEEWRGRRRARAALRVRTWWSASNLQEDEVHACHTWSLTRQTPAQRPLALERGPRSPSQDSGHAGGSRCPPAVLRTRCRYAQVLVQCPLRHSSGTLLRRAASKELSRRFKLAP
jgi:hypothetical protein